MTYDTFPTTASARPARRPPERAPLPLAPRSPSDGIARFCARIDAAFDALSTHADPPQHAAFAQRLRAALAEAAATPGLLAPEQRESGASGYRRHLLAADPLGRYAVVSLVWGQGQASPVHGHHTWCGYAVLEGELGETIYEWDAAAGCAAEARRQPRCAGAVSYVRAGTAGIHRLAHAGGPGASMPAVSLHVYGVSGERVATHVNDVVAVASAEHRE